MTKTYHIMLVDDDREMRESLSQLFESSGFSVTVFASAAKAQGAVLNGRFDCIVTDLRMPGMSGLELLEQISDAAAPPIIMISAHGDISTAVEAMQKGAYSFFEKPFDPKRLLLAVRHAAEQHQLSQANNILRLRLLRLTGLDRVLLGQSPEMSMVRDQISDLEGLDVPVMILGETGTGKDLVAHALHDLSNTPETPFIAVNCAALLTSEFETVMFGHADGRQGYMQAAGNGTLFLDELSAMPESLQAKLLRVLETKEVTPVGSIHPQPALARILSATNSDIEIDIASGKLRSDLIYRLNTTTVVLPNLRHRIEDVPLLFSNFLLDYSRIYEVAAPTLTNADTADLLAHSWPGNVRELRNVAERRVLAARRGGRSCPKLRRRHR